MNKILPILFFLIFLTIFAISTATFVQINGILRCHNQTLKNATVELWEKDLLDPNDFINRTFTDDDGIFEIFGENSEIFGSIDPFLSILHNCSPDKKKNCTYRIEIPLKLMEENGTMRKEDFEANFGTEEDQSKEENCSDKMAENDEILAEKLASSNETENAKNGENLDGNKTKVMNELPPDGMAADLDTFAGTEMPAEMMNGTSMGMVDEDEEMAFNLTNSPTNDENNGGETSMSPKQQQQVY